MENNQWQVTLAQVGGQEIPLTDVGFLEFAKTLPDDMLYQTLKLCDPITEGNLMILFHQFHSQCIYT